MIKVNNLSYTYPGAEQRVLNKLNFEIEKGEIFGFLGPSGAGKSTTQKVLYKILNGFDGEILIGGKNLNNLGNSYFEQIGVGFELPNHYLKLTARENLQLFASFYNRKSIIDLNTLFELVGLEDSIDKKVETFSKGMQMRLNFIRAIMHQPAILFFDEPTAGLDPINAHKLKQHILQLKSEGKTIFITTHNMSTADEICDRVSFIVDGVLQVTESPRLLKNKHGEHKVVVDTRSAKEVEFPLDGIGKNEDFLSFLKSNEVLKINTKEASLEEVFIEVTGKALVS
jgi:fluoroquinolone transport system ATP-binding protein